MARYQFDSFEFESGTDLLFAKDGAPIPLQGQPARLLRYLIENAGRVVTREELQQAVWGELIVDQEHGLNYAIRQIRIALGDSAREPRFLETLPRRGYRFLPEVTLGAPPPSPRVFPAWRRTAALLSASGLLWLAPVMFRSAQPCDSLADRPVFDTRAALQQADHLISEAVHTLLGGHCPYDLMGKPRPRHDSGEGSG